MGFHTVGEAQRSGNFETSIIGGRDREPLTLRTDGADDDGKHFSKAIKPKGAQ